MANVSVYNMEGKEVDRIDLNDAVFGVEINEHLVHMAVVQQLANKRQGTQKAKTRSEVSGGGRKPCRKEKQAAIRSALTSRVQGNKLIVLDELKLNEIKTKDMKKVLDNLKVGKALVVTGVIDRNVIISARNLPDVRTSYVAVEHEGDERKVNSTINVYDIMKYDTVVLTKEAVANIEEVYA